MNLQDVLIVEELKKNKITEDNLFYLKSCKIFLQLFFDMYKNIKFSHNAKKVNIEKS